MAISLRLPVRFGIRSKLFVAALSLLVIPWIGTRYIQEVENFLRQQQETLLRSRTQMVAAVLQGQPGLFATKTDSPLPVRGITHVYVRPLDSAIQLDGYLDDWRLYDDRMQHYGLEHAIKASEASSLSFNHQVGTYGRYLYAIFQINDDRIVYRQPNSTQLDKSDRLIIALETPRGEYHRYLLTTIAPGWVNAHRITGGDSDDGYRNEIRIKGEWQETAQGYNIEIRIPLTLIGDKLSFAIADVDDKTDRHTETVIATAGLDEVQTLGTIVIPSPQVEHMLQRLHYPNTRSWVIDKHYRVIGRSGSLVNREGHIDRLPYDDEPANAEPSLLNGFMQLIYRMILKQPATEFQDELLTASRLDTEEFRSALAGHVATRWRQTPDKQTNILTAVSPVWHHDEVVGAVAIEQTSNSVLLLQNRAFEILINLSLLAFLIAAVILLTFASRLSWRVRRLRDNAERAITPDGRVVGKIKTTHDRDEIGDLSRSFSDVLDRLANYNRYLETMASKLSHELRTPITVVRSSLDNLAGDNDDSDTQVYLTRAQEGLQRLNNILTRMSEATRLEQTIQNEPRQVFALNELIDGCVNGYRTAHPAITFESTLAKDPICVYGSKDLLAQMLDKLVNNAIDFHTPETPIQLVLTRDEDAAIIEVRNQGPTLPEHMHHNLFDSMVSIRDKRTDEPHLGLGLYIVRMIVDFHGGTVRADNTEHPAGVCFHIRLPRDRTS
jgi:dedicated sortase system histidine kinase